MSKEQETLILKLLVDCLQLNFRKRNILLAEYHYLFNVLKNTDIPLKRIIEERIFDLKHSAFEANSDKLIKHAKIRISFNKKILKIICF